MLDPLIAIPGPLFLLLFWILSAVVILILRYRLEGGSLPLDRLPDPAQLRPQTLAVLRGGVNAVIRTATFKLWREGTLLLETTGGTNVLRAATDVQKPQDRVEALVLDACKEGCTPGELFQRLSPTVDGILEPEYRELVQRGLMKGEDAQAAAWKGTLAALFILALVGTTKLWLGLERDKPVGFLIVSLFLIPLLTLVILKPWRPHPLTATGRRFLKDAQERLSWMVNPSPTASNDNASQAVMAMALFGMGGLALDPTNESFRRSFSRGSGSGCSGGCGSSSWSGSEGGSGGSDGGGDSGGGSGCGGCGGGGGD